MRKITWSSTVSALSREPRGVKTVCDFLKPEEAHLFLTLATCVNTLDTVKQSLKGSLRQLPAETRTQLNRSCRAASRSRLGLWYLARERAAAQGIDWLPIHTELDDETPWCRYCSKCRRVQTLSSFARGSKAGRYDAYCKRCRNKAAKKRYAQLKEVKSGKEEGTEGQAQRP